MTPLLDAGTAAPTAYGSARLLAGTTTGRTADLGRHRASHGELRVRHQADLAALADQVRLLGRGGAAFPVAAKLRAMPRGGGSHVLVNGSESEPASHKDRALMRLTRISSSTERSSWPVPSAPARSPSSFVTRLLLPC